MRAALRWVRGDLRARRGESVFTVILVAMITTVLIIGSTLLEEGTNPWRGLFTETRGAHLWVHAGAGTDLSRLAEIDEVAQLTGPHETAPTTLATGGHKAPLTLRAVQPRQKISRPAVRSGRWLRANDSGAIVVENSFAEAMDLRAGGTIPVRGLDGHEHRLRVVGVAESADQGFYPDWTPGLAWTDQNTLERIEPTPGSRESVAGLRLHDPEATDLVAQRASTMLAGRIQRISTWQEVRTAMALDNRLLGQFLALFGAAALLAAALAIAGATGGRVLVQTRDIAMLKALGFTARQVAGMLFLRHALLGVTGVAIGVAVGSMTCSALSLPVPADVLAMIATGAMLVVVAATLLPASRGSRTRPLPATHVRRPHRRLSRLVRLALLVRLPPALVLGVRDAFTHRALAWLTITGVAIPVMMITMGLGSWETLDDFQERPERIGQAMSLTVRPGGMTDSAAKQIIAEMPGVAASYPGVEAEVLVPGQTQTVLARAIGDTERPYPFPVAEGRPIRARGEAVAGQGFLDLVNAQIGDRVRVTVGGSPIITRIVGRVIEPEQDGQVLSLGVDTLPEKDAEPPEFYGLVLADGASATDVRAKLIAAANGKLDVQRVVNPADRLAMLRTVIIVLTVVLGMIILGNLFTANTLRLHDHAVDLDVLKAIGLTPRQVTATLITGTTLLALIAVLAGTAAGWIVTVPLIDLQAATSGVGAGIGQSAGIPTLVISGTATLAAVILTALIPVRRALVRREAR